MSISMNNILPNAIHAYITSFPVQYLIVAGGGGGGSSDWGAGGNGGSGIVIISSPKAATGYTGTVNIPTVGTNTVYQFLTSGTITF